jgi:hypothetical protein
MCGTNLFVETPHEHGSWCFVSSRVVNVHIVKGSGDEVLSTFAQCLQSLPNVHTLQISGVIGQLATAIKTAFKGHRFLQIRTVIIPAIAHHILSSCPQVKDITCIGRPKEFFISTIAKKCKQVEALNMMVYINYTIECECFTSDIG